MMTYPLFYIFCALLSLSTMLALKKEIESSGVRGKRFWTLAIIGAILAPVIIVVTFVYAAFDMLKRAWRSQNKTNNHDE